MSQKTELQSNNTDLQSILATINALPDAGGGTDTSDATATADEIFAGETAYTSEGKVTGTFTIDSELTEQSDLISQISTLVATKANYSTLYIGSSEPTSDIGSDGDIYIVRS